MTIAPCETINEGKEMPATNQVYIYFNQTNQKRFDQLAIGSLFKFIDSQLDNIYMRIDLPGRCVLLKTGSLYTIANDKEVQQLHENEEVRIRRSV